MFKNRKLIGIAIIFWALILRIIGLNWDSGFHFHPDERMLIMVADKVRLFSQLNPDFFNYGTLPIYILKGASQFIDLFFNANTANYDGLLYVGRWISTFTDMLVIVLIYKIAKLVLKSRVIALWSCFFYAISFFPIQNAHFFVVDVYLNLFATLLLYLILRYHENPTGKGILQIGIIYAAALTTKVSAIIFFPVIILVILITHGRKLKWWKRILASIMAVIHHDHDSDMKKYMTSMLAKIILLLATTGIFAFIFMPYAFFEYKRFFNDVLLQTTMNSNPYIFPYTLQYVGTTPYLYYLKNIFLWGVGPAIGILAIAGIIDLSVSHLHGLKEKFNTFPNTFKKVIFLINALFDNNIAIMVVFYLIYFVVIGQSAVKFMRYMLLLYPFIAILAGAGAMMIQQLRFRMGKKWIALPILPIFVTIACLWTISFVSIYSQKNTRIRATEWINQYIPAGATLAVEHWDDRVPIFDPGKYQYVEMTLYDQPDDNYKWQILNDKLNSADYIILASNRLYIPLQKLNDCKKYKSCYPLTAKYYEDLFANKRGFTKKAEFSSYPHLSFGSIKLTIPDDAADESFTVYDHPKILIFKKNIK